MDKNQLVNYIVKDDDIIQAIQTQEIPSDGGLMKDTLSVKTKHNNKLDDSQYIAVKDDSGNDNAFYMYKVISYKTTDNVSSFEAVQVANYELTGYIVKDIRPTYQTAEYVANQILKDSDWRLGYVADNLSLITTNYYYVNAKDALKDLQQRAGGEFVFKVEISGNKIADKWVELRKQVGDKTNKRFTYGNKALKVEREVNNTEIYTALIGRGKGEEVTSADENESGQAGYGRKITFEDIEWKKSKGDPVDKPKGQTYVELPEMTAEFGIKTYKGFVPRIGVVEFSDQEDPTQLLKDTYKELQYSARPKVLFSAVVVNVGNVSIGDTVTIHRHDLDFHYAVRIIKVERNLVDNNRTKILLGDHVVNPSTKQQQNVSTQLKSLAEVAVENGQKATVAMRSADGKNTVYHGATEPDRARIGDIWFRPHPSIENETQQLVFNGNTWEIVTDTSDLTKVAREVESAIEEVEKAVQSAKDADVRANEAIEKAGANANLLTTHQNTLNTIKNTTIPNVNKVASDAMAEAKSALSSASSAMNEAKKADGKIADYVTKNGLVNGTTVDSKIDDATGEISKKITTVESKIPTEIGGRNYFSLTNLNKIQPTNWVVRAYVYNLKLEPNTKYTLSSNLPDQNGDSSKTNIYFNGSGTAESGVWEGKSVTNTSDDNGNIYVAIPTGRPYTQDILDGKYWVQLEKGTIKTDWSPAPEDNYTQEEFKIFESTYKEDVKGINSTLTDLSNKKLDGSTYTTFYNNEYKKTAQGVTDTYAKVNKIIDANGNSTDTFAKAVYDKNATRQSADFQNVTKNLVQTATYTAGINGVKQSITSIRGDLDNLSVGGRNLIDESMVTSTVSTFDKSEYVTKGLITFSSSGGTYGLRINASKLEPNTDYVMSYKYQKTGGELRSFGGHTDGAFSNNTVYVDGANSGVGYSSYKSVYVGDDEGVHNVVVKFTTPSTVTPSNLIYIQPNRTTTATVSVNIFDWKMEKGTIPTDWSPAPEDMLGKADFQVFKGTYENNDQTIKNRLTAIDSGAKGSVVYNTNLALSTAQGNTNTISSVRGDLDSLAGGGRNYAIDTSNTMKYYLKILTYSGHLDQDNKLTTKTKYTLSDLDAKVGDWYTASIYIGQSGGFGSSVKVYNQDVNSIRAKGNRAGHGYSSVTFQVLEGDTEFNFYLGNESGNGTNYQIEAKEFQIEKGKIRTAWKPAISEQMGKAEFTIFKNDYEETAKSVERRLNAIDSSAEGSVVTRLNKTESTASGNSQLISTINKNYVKQSNIDASILADKKIKDTRNTNELPPYYYSKYPKQEVREFKLVSVMGVGSGTYGILTTNVPWGDGSGGRVQQTFDTETEKFTRQGSSGWSAWVKQIDTADSTYQKVVERSNLYERVLGSTDETGVKSSISRIIQTSDVIKTEVAKMDLSGTNYVLNSDEYVWTNNYHVKTYDLADEIPKGTKIKISIWGGLSSGVRTFGVWINNSTGQTSTNSQNVDLVQQSGTYGQGQVHPLQKWTAEITLNVPASKILIFGRDNNSTHAKRVEYVQVETGATFTPWKPSSKGLSSTITQLADNINLKVSKSDLISQINVQAGGVLITSGTNKLNVTPTTTYIQNGTIESAMIKSLDAGKIKTGTLDAGKVKVINIDAENITSNKTSFVQSAWNAINSRLSVTGSELKYTHSDGSYTRLNANGIQTVVGGSAYQHNYLTHVSNITINSGSAGNVKWVQLPSVFKGKQFEYFMGATDIYGAVTEDAYYQNKMMLKRFVLIKHPDYNIDYANARIPILGYAHYVDIDTRNDYFRALQGVVFAQY